MIAVLVLTIAGAGPALSSPSFEDLVRMSDRIVTGKVQGPAAGSVRLPDGKEIALGVKDPVSGIVYTAYRIVIDGCLFDADEECVPGESEVSFPGGTIYETVEGERRLRTWEIAGAGGLPHAGEERLLMMTKRQGRYVALNDRAARATIDPKVPLDRLKRRVESARQVPRPTSENPHATPSWVGSVEPGAVRPSRARVRAGEDSGRREPALELGDHRGSAHRPGDDRRSCGP